MSISSIVTRGYGAWGSIYDLAVRGYSTGSIQLDVYEMDFTGQSFTAGEEAGGTGGGSMFIGYVMKLLR